MNLGTTMGRAVASVLFSAMILAGLALPRSGRAQEERAGARAASPAVSDSALEAQVRALAATLRCPVCQNLSIQDSPSELAQEMRDLIRERLLAGDTPDEVRGYFVSRYGEWVLLEPRRRGFNLAVWVFPVLAVLAGIALVVSVVRRWTRRVRPPAGGLGDVAEEDLARVRRELEEFEMRGG